VKIMRTNKQTDRQTESHTLTHTDADDRYTHATPIGVSNNNCKLYVAKLLSTDFIFCLCDTFTRHVPAVVVTVQCHQRYRLQKSL